MDDLTIADLNHCISLFGENQKSFMRSEKRASLRSVLFDVPRRSSLGWHCIYQCAVPFLTRISEQISPEEAGRRMKRLCSRPYYLTLSILMCSMLGARQQLILDGNVKQDEPFPDERLDELMFLVDFWQRTCQCYRNDGLRMPAEANHTQAILPADTVRELNGLLKPFSAPDHRRTRRLAATLELYCFILHGEQRDGLFAHGPYPASDGTQVVIHEFTDLQNDFLPWAATKARIPYPNLAIVRRVRDVQMKFDLFGGVLLDPPDVAGQTEAEEIFTRDRDGAIRPVSREETEHIQHCAAKAQNEIYMKATEWSPRFKAEYGVYLFANHLRSFFDLLDDRPSVDEEILGDFLAAIENEIEPMLADSDPPSIWRFMATTEQEFFWPVIPAETISTSTGKRRI